MDKKDKRIYLASAIACVVILLGKYGYSYYQDRNALERRQKQKQAIELQQKKPILPKKKPIVPRPSIGNPAPYGIEIENTTEEEIRDRFEVIKEDSIYNKKYKVLYLNADDFSSESLPVKKVELILDQKGLVIRFLMHCGGKRFSQLHSELSKKYTVASSDIPSVGDNTALYVSKNIEIALVEPHMEFITALSYVTKQFSDEILFYQERYRQEEQQKIAEQL
ncbi:MAG: hypothetical protein LBB21_03475 [Holosporaceae bacterium]|jgi:hypothetical protein|nr:hypothetical protein [Holosporaceae bacterium]